MENREIVQYHVLMADDDVKLNKTVEEWMQKGWKPYGPPQASIIQPETYHISRYLHHCIMQAMVKYK